MPLAEFLSFALALGCGAFVQSAAGFAGGLVIMPLLVWSGHGIPEAQAAMLIATVPQNLLGIYRFRDTITPGEVALPAAMRLSMLPVGMAALFYIDSFPQDALRQFICGVVAGFVILLLCLRPKPKQSVHAFWMWLAFLTSGFFAGCTGTGGPMIVLWVQAHDWSTERTRAFLFCQYLIVIPVSMSILFYAFGSRITPPTLAAAVLIPLLFAVSSIGLRVGSWLGRERLRMLTMAILLFVGLAGLITPMLAKR